MEDFYKEVNFEKYCKTCEYKDQNEIYDPCHECLSEPTNVGSEKPVKWVEKSKKNRG